MNSGDTDSRGIVATGDETPPTVPVGALQIGPQTPLSKCPASFDTTTMSGRCKLFNAVSASCTDMDGGDDAEIDAVDWAVIPGETTDNETGEVKYYATVVLFARDGFFLKTSGEVVVHRLAAALRLFAPGEWRQGIHFRLVSRTSRKGRRYYDLMTEA